ncbi:Hypothetical protein A7982_07847 [Minicystis rosea]|nr:Hypothetical protein A7982_07847 [Minicystis rosea]
MNLLSRRSSLVRGSSRSASTRPRRPEVLSVPSPRCARMRPINTTQSSAWRVSPLPSAWDAGEVIDVVELQTTDETCVHDALASRAVLRGEPAEAFCDREVAGGESHGRGASAARDVRARRCR